MERAGGERAPAGLPGAVLAMLVVAALGLGAWWWTDHAPPVPPGGDSLPLPGRSPAASAAPPASGGSATLVDLLDGDELAAALLPRDGEAVLKRGAVLGPGGSVIHAGAAPTNEDYLLEMTCRGDGAVTVEITLPNLGPESQELTCDGAVRGVVLSYRFGHAAIRAWTPAAADGTVLFAFQVRPR